MVIPAPVSGVFKVVALSMREITSAQTMLLMDNIGSPKAISLGAAFLALLTIVLTYHVPATLSELIDDESLTGQIFYKIPDPFWSGTEYAADGYFYIKSFQCTITSHKKKVQTLAEEYFSLTYGLTYSLHRNRDDPTQEYAIIGDGPQGKSYIVRNPYANLTEEELDCELDHVHHHKQVFPWQYVYEVTARPSEVRSPADSSSSDSKQDASKRKRNKKKNKWLRKRFIYGAGAIWMNAIKREVVSNEVGDDSPFPSSNIWLMREADLEIKLMFDKPKKWPKATDQEGRKRAIADSSLGSIQVRRQNAIESEEEMGGMNSLDESMDLITIQEFKRKVSVEDKAMRRFFSQLSECRRHNKKHRIFPSLTRALSTSPERLYAMVYVQRRFGSLRVDESKMSETQPDPTYHRFVRNVELHTEWFSLKQEAQTDVYEAADFWGPQQDFSGVESHLTDVFIKRLTEREGQRSSRHSTVQYHVRERGDGIESCKVGETDPAPKWFSLMMRHVHLRRPDGKSVTSLITGVGALLMNAADTHYKQFSLFKRTINALYDPVNLEARKRVTVEEWQLFHTSTGRTVHFLFAERDNGRNQAQEIGDLVRIDVRDSTVKSKDSDVVIESANDDDPDDPSLLMRFEILSLDLNKDSDSIEFMFTPPKTCFKDGEDTPANDDGYNGDSDDDDIPEDLHPEDDRYTLDENEDDGNKEEKDEEQAEGEDFEFEPGKEMESFQFPEFYDFFEDQTAYKIVYTIELVTDEDEDDDKATKQIHLMELVDRAASVAWHKVFYSRKALDELKADLEFYVDYNEEKMFRISGGKSCSPVEDLDPWFRLLSAKLTYWRRLTNKASLTVEGSRLRSYGLSALWRLASQSENAYFLGMRKAPLIINDSTYRVVSWGMDDDGDSQLLTEFKFLWNATQFNLDSAVGLNRRPNELLHLHSVSLIPFPDVDETNVNTNFVKSVRIPPPISVEPLTAEETELVRKMPQVCQDQKPTDKDAKPEQSELDTRIPSFWDYIQKTNSYCANYYVSHAPQYEQPESAAMKTAQSLSIRRIFEHFDRNLNMGKMVVGYGPEVREVYIDDNRHTIHTFMPSTKLCKRVSSLSGLIELVQGFQKQEVDFNSGQMFGLAALWIRLSELTYQMEVSRVIYRSDTSGKRREVRTYSLQGEINGAQRSNSIVYEITATFIGPPLTGKGGLQKPDISEYELESVDFRPRYAKSFSGRAPLHRTTITVDWMSKKHDPVDILLPIECTDDPGDPTPADDSDPDNSTPENRDPGPAPTFPALSTFIKATDQFSMRSEITSMLAFSEETKLYIMDEWYFAGNVRLKTYGLHRDFDLLVYSSSKEAFDLSTPYQCPRTVPKLYLPSVKRQNPDFLDFWAGDKTHVDYLSWLFYGPVALWRQAELNPERVKLVDSLELAPLPTSDIAKATPLDRISELEREMRTEIWRMTSPNEDIPWSYDMYFERFVNKETQRQWRVLRSIEIYDSVPKNEIDLGVKRFIEIEIANYRYNHTDDELAQKFLLPDGYQCYRDEQVTTEMRKSNDDLAVDWTAEHQMWYDASLELLDESSTVQQDMELGSLGGNSGSVVLSTASGMVVRSGSKKKSEGNQNIADLFVHYKKNHYINGTTTSTKTVFHRQSSLIHVMDQRTGSCDIGQDLSGKTLSQWRIEFPSSTGDGRTEYIVLDDMMIELLFGQLDLYRPINRYEHNGYEFATYEHSLLNLPDQVSIRGPATIVKRFQRHKSEKILYRVDKRGTATKLHHAVSINLLIFDPTKTRVTAILRLSLRGSSNVDLTELIRYADISQCYNDGDQYSDRQVRTFVVEYKATAGAILGARVREAATTRDFLLGLMKTKLLLPLQFHQAPRLEFASNGRLAFSFSLMEPPTAIEFASKRQVEWRMSPELEALAQMRIVSTVAECSNWCDQVGCIDMTYCSDRTCYVLTLNMIRAKVKESALTDLNDSLLTGKEIAELFAPVPDQQCVNFIWSAGARPSTLDKFASSMKSAFNQPTQDTKTGPLAALRLTVFANFFETLSPVKFYEIKDELDFFKEDSDLEGKCDAIRLKPQATYRIVWHNQQLEHQKLEQILASGVGTFAVSADHSRSYTDCLKTCRDDPWCMMVSYCKQPATCLLVSGQAHDIKTLETALGPQQSVSAGCLVAARDFLAPYTQFADTQEPSSFQLKFDNYSALECAALCDHYDGSDKTLPFKCLSFDSCSLPVTTDSGQLIAWTEANSRSSTCYLQSVHVMMDAFDRSILKANKLNPIHKSSVNFKGKQPKLVPRCDHYSKPALADFKHFPQRQVASAGEASELVEGLSAEKCAVECHEDERCRGFEYCFDDTRQPVQVCLYIRQNTSLLQPGDDADSKMFTRSTQCSVYVLEHQVEEYKVVDAGEDGVGGIILNAAQQVATHGSGFFQRCLLIAGVLFIGLLVQMAYIRIVGAPITYVNLRG